MSDITRLLYLLNKKPSAVEMPPDGVQLLTWSEQILHRYQASHVRTTHTSIACTVAHTVHTYMYYTPGIHGGSQCTYKLEKRAHLEQIVNFS